ncbi:MAG: cupredoxin domain-containing protein [bacterium]
MLRKVAFSLIVIILITQIIISWRNNKTPELLHFDRLGTNASSSLVTGDKLLRDSIKLNQTPIVVNLLSSPYQFTPNIIKAKVGVPLKVRILSKGKHTFTIDEFAIKVETPDDQNTDVLFIPDKIGTFRFYSSYLEDAAGNMTGRLIVK